MSTAPFWLEYRLRFIDFLLARYGYFQRADLCDQFGISTPQASLDIRAYIERWPTNIEYDKSLKRYVRTATYERKCP